MRHDGQVKCPSDKTIITKFGLLPKRQEPVQGIMILPSAAGGVPGRGEIPMELVRNRPPDDVFE